MSIGPEEDRDHLPRPVPVVLDRRPRRVTDDIRQRAGSSAPSDLPCGIDDRVTECRQEAPVVEVPPRVEIAPMVGGNRAPSTPQHPATSEDKAQKLPPRAEVLRRAGARKDAVGDRWERE